MARAFAIALIEISGLPECDKVEIRFVLRFLGTLSCAVLSTSWRLGEA